MKLLNLTDKHKGQTFFIGGSSPNIHQLDKERLKEGVVIGVNQFPDYYPSLDYWIAYDSFNLLTKKGYQAWLKEVKAFKFLLKDPKVYEIYWNKPEYCDQWYLSTHAMNIKEVPKPDPWDGKLCHYATTALDAVHLAYIMGASEIVLWGVDLTGGSRADGSKYASEDYWSMFADRVSVFLNMLPIPVYKTNPDSPLLVGYRDYYKKPL